MVSLALTACFFWMFLIFYPASLIVMTFIGWLIKKIGRKKANKELEKRRLMEIDQKIDNMKDMIFKISIGLTFFIIAPSIIFYLYFLE